MSLEKAITQKELTADTVELQFCSDWLKDEMKRLFRVNEAHMRMWNHAEEENAKLRKVVDAARAIGLQGNGVAGVRLMEALNELDGEKCDTCSKHLNAFSIPSFVRRTKVWTLILRNRNK